MRPHGRAKVSRTSPQAWGVCERCGFLYLHKDLTWSFEWIGPRLHNQRHLVCPSCQDKPAEFLKTIILPPDPIPIANPREEPYTHDLNPVSGQNFDPLTVANVGTLLNGAIGNMTAGGGVNAPFAGAPQKNSYQGALRTPSIAGAANYVGQNWCAQPGVPPTLPSQLTAYGTTYALANFTAQAPSDAGFLASGGPIAVELDGWISNAWSPLWSGTSAGGKGETLAVTLTSSAQAPCYGHRLLLTGDGVNAMGIAFLQFNALGAAKRTTPPTVTPS